MITAAYYRVKKNMKHAREKVSPEGAMLVDPNQAQAYHPPNLR